MADLPDFPSPSELQVMLQRAKLALQKGDYETADELARAAARCDLESAQARLLIALTCFHRGRFRSAALSLCKLGASTDCAAAYEIAGDIHRRDNRLQDALECYLSAGDVGQEMTTSKQRCAALADEMRRRISMEPNRYPETEWV